ncbi:MAG: hypothetical protein ACRD2J_07215, partial [Thermoanaerobaculia bacterium]
MAGEEKGEAARRPRLRTRILTISVAYGILLVAVAFLLTWRARESQRELGRIVDVELRAARDLEDALRNHHAFVDRWTEAAARGDDADLVELAPRYALVTQPLATLPEDAPPEVRRAGSRLAAFARRVDSIAAELVRSDT